MEPILVWAHRGASGYAPENTLEAFALAVKQGADGVELDVHLSADGQVVVAHDETVDRVSDGKGRIVEMRLEQLKALNFNRPRPGYAPVARIPTLEEVLALLAPTRLSVNVELKNDAQEYPRLEEKCLALVGDAGMRGRVWFSSFNHDSMRRVKALDPAMPCGALYERKLPEPAWTYARRIGVDAVHPDYGMLLRDKAQVAACREAGVRVHTWTVNAAPSLRAVARLAPHAIITNYPDRALRELGR